MADSFLEHCGGWTPAPDVLTRNYGFETAYTWGRIRRLCQLGGGTFTASHEAIGKRIGMSRRALIEILKDLIRDGYVEDLTPGVRNKAHTYSVKKGEAKILTGMQISHTESDISLEDTEGIEPKGIDVGMRNLHSEDAEIAHLDLSGMQNLHTDYAEIAQPGMQNLHLKRESLDTSSRDIKDSSPNGEVPPPLPKEEAIKVEYTPFLRDFLARFNAKRFRNPTQFKTVSDLVEQHGETELESLAEWAANKGMGLGQAIPAIKSALTNPKRTKHVAEEAAWETPPDPIPKPPQPEHVTIWEVAAPMVRGQMTGAMFDTLLKDAQPIERENGTFELRVKASALEMIAGRPKVRANILTAIQAVKPEIHDLDFTTWPVEAKELKL